MTVAAASMGLSPRSPRGDLLAATPPLSPTGLAGQFASQLMTGQLSVGAPGQLLSEGSGITLGVEVLAAERQRQRGAWCARLRDAGCCSGSGSGAAGVGGSPAGLSGVLQSPSNGVLCLACGSQDQQLIRALKEFVAIRSVSAHKVSCGVAVLPKQANIEVVVTPLSVLSLRGAQIAAVYSAASR
eukprot:GHUV01033406.1.p1 GENE.GHUV01033406.1~~GHUV01033406.1.p1  ORF type:complete len:201 (-),score=46.58 GHUV01033406.1:347-901(-)